MKGMERGRLVGWVGMTREGYTFVMCESCLSQRWASWTGIYTSDYAYPSTCSSLHSASADY